MGKMIENGPAFPLPDHAVKFLRVIIPGDLQQLILDGTVAV